MVSVYQFRRKLKPRDFSTDFDLKAVQTGPPRSSSFARLGIQACGCI
jgi:hypothetical protein